MTESTTNGYMKASVVKWILGIFMGFILMVLGAMWSHLGNVSETFNHNVTEIKEDITDTSISCFHT